MRGFKMYLSSLISLWCSRMRSMMWHVAKTMTIRQFLFVAGTSEVVWQHATSMTLFSAQQERVKTAFTSHLSHKLKNPWPELLSAQHHLNLPAQIAVWRTDAKWKVHLPAAIILFVEVEERSSASGLMTIQVPVKFDTASITSLLTGRACPQPGPIEHGSWTCPAPVFNYMAQEIQEAAIISSLPIGLWETKYCWCLSNCSSDSTVSPGVWRRLHPEPPPDHQLRGGEVPAEETWRCFLQTLCCTHSHSWRRSWSF